MKFYSEKLNKLYETQEQCALAEEEHEKKIAEAEAKKKALDTERATRAKEVEKLYHEAVDAKKVYDKALRAFLDDYGSFHTTFKTTDPFFGLFDWF